MCMTYELNHLHHVGVVAKTGGGARRGQQYPFGPDGPRGKYVEYVAPFFLLMTLSQLKKISRLY